MSSEANGVERKGITGEKSTPPIPRSCVGNLKEKHGSAGNATCVSRFNEITTALTEAICVGPDRVDSFLLVHFISTEHEHVMSFLI